MARLPRKPELLRVVERALRECGWSLLHLTREGGHPASYQLFRENQSQRLKVYIWNLTHGGGAMRPAQEYRIQITGIAGPQGGQQFIPEPGGKTLILGWWGQVGVFAGFDARRHAGVLGASPSIQIGEEALRRAMTDGFYPHNKGNGELAIAFRPDFIDTYINNLEELHSCGQPQEIDVLERVSNQPLEIPDEEIERAIPQERQFAVVSTVRALRDLSFRSRVMAAYSSQCAMCGLQLRLLDAAHILPVAHPESTDETSNGVSLCSLHHRAYDRGLVTFDEQFRTHLNEGQLEELREVGLDGGGEAFRNNLRPVISLPPDQRDRPNPHFVAAVNDLRGWRL